jgi:hypothetical protein
MSMRRRAGAPGHSLISTIVLPPPVQTPEPSSAQTPMHGDGTSCCGNGTLSFIELAIV